MYQVDVPELIKEERDHFELYSKIEGIKKLLESFKSSNTLQNNNLIALYGEWGSGKSSIVRTIKETLNKEEFKPVLFEAWKYEKDDNLTFSIFEAIMDNIIEDKEALKNILKEGFYEGLKSFANGITLKTPIIDFDLKNATPLKEENSLYTKIENFIDKFKDKLEKHSSNKTVVVFIDDLDRCEDENIINLLISLKLMFTLENIIFVCCIDRSATIEALKRKYNNNLEKAESFLDKLFIFDFNLIPTYGNNFINEIFVCETEKKILNSVFFDLHIKNPRVIKKIINKINLIESISETTFESDFSNKLYKTIFYYILSLKEVDLPSFNLIVENLVSAGKIGIATVNNNKNRLHITNLSYKQSIGSNHNKIDKVLQNISDVFSLTFKDKILNLKNEIPQASVIEIVINKIKLYS